jgi:hypothetical protein
MVNEIQELRAELSHQRDRSLSLGAAAYAWLEERYLPTCRALSALDASVEAPELYCQLLEHKWYASERAQRDVGHEAALEGFVANARLATPVITV